MMLHSMPKTIVFGKGEMKDRIHPFSLLKVSQNSFSESTYYIGTFLRSIKERWNNKMELTYTDISKANHSLNTFLLKLLAAEDIDILTFRYFSRLLSLAENATINGDESINLKDIGITTEKIDDWMMDGDRE